MILGAHEETAGGLPRALERGVQDKALAVQLFCKNPRQWKARPLTEKDLAAFLSQRAASSIECCAVHDSYLINLGDPEQTGQQRSLESFLVEVERTAALQIEALIFHPGSHKQSGEEDCLARIAANLNIALEQFPTGPQLLLETTAGQGTNVGYCFEHLATILEKLHFPERAGICLDTAHIFEAGYDLRTPKVYEQTISTLDRIIGLSRLKAIHLNDSKTPLGSKVDRHEQIGEGHLGREPFAMMLHDPRLAQIPAYLETPPLPDGTPSFAQNLARLRDWIQDPTISR